MSNSSQPHELLPFSACLQSFLASGPFLMSWLFTSGGQSIGASASASFLPMNIQDWFPLGWIGWISLQSKELSRGFSSTTVQKHQFFAWDPPIWVSVFPQEVTMWCQLAVLKFNSILMLFTCRYVSCQEQVSAPQDFRCQLQVQVFSCVSDQVAVNQRSPSRPPWFPLIC